MCRCALESPRSLELAVTCIANRIAAFRRNDACTVRTQGIRRKRVDSVFRKDGPCGVDDRGRLTRIGWLIPDAAAAGDAELRRSKGAPRRIFLIGVFTCLGM